MVFGSNYLHKVFNPVTFQQTLGVVNSILATVDNPFDAVAVRGISGASVGFGLSALYGHNVLYARKEETTSHGWLVEGPTEDIKRYVIVDDFIDSGHTIKELISTIKRRAEGLLFYSGRKDAPAECVGIVLYNAHSFSQGTEKFEDTGIQIYVASIFEREPKKEHTDK